MFRQFLEKKFDEQPFRHWYSSTAVFTAVMAAKANVAMVLIIMQQIYKNHW